MQSFPQSNKPQTFQKSLNHLSAHSIYVIPLPLDITEADMRFLFSLCGPIQHVNIIRKRYPKGCHFAYVHFSTLEAKQKAKRFYNGKFLGLKKLEVTDDKFMSLQPKREKAYCENFDKETVYGDDQNGYNSRPHKRVHKNEKQDFENSYREKSMDKRHFESSFSSSSRQQQYSRRYNQRDRTSSRKLENTFAKKEENSIKQEPLSTVKIETKIPDSFEY